MDPNEHPDGVSKKHLMQRSGLTSRQVLDALATRGIEKIGKGPATRYKLVELLVEEDDY